MSLSTYLEEYKISTLPQDYKWDNVWFNKFWATNDSSNPRLTKSLGKISLRSAFSLQLACAEWVVARVEDHTDTRDALLRIEAAWAATLDWRYADLPKPESTPASEPAVYASPLRLAMKLVAYSHQTLADTHRGVFPCTRGMAMLVKHITGRNKAFGPWLEAALELAQEHFPNDSDIPYEDQDLIPKSFFEPGFVWRDTDARASLEEYVTTLDPARNKYLRKPAAMKAAGFTGKPYKRST